MSYNEWKKTEVGSIPADWEYASLNEKVEVTLGQSPKSEYYNNFGMGIPFLQGRQAFGDKYPTIDTWCTNPIRIARKGDVLLSIRAPVGDLNIANQDICIGRGLAALRMKNNSAPLNEQKAIAKILSELDEKIEINNRMIKVLEEIAQTIFKHWFVDFEFPNENGEPYKSSGGEMIESELGPIPKGWEVVKLGEIVEIISGYSYNSSELQKSNIALMTIKNFDVDGMFTIQGFKEIKPSKGINERYCLNLFDIVIACTDLTQNARIIGNVAMVLTKAKYDKILASMDLVKIRPKSIHISNCTLYEFLKAESFKHFALSITSGTTVLHLNKRGLLNYKIPLPSDRSLFKRLDYIFDSLFKLIANIYNENQLLSQLRDTLLPKLMSGEIRVPLEQFVQGSETENDR